MKSRLFSTFLLFISTALACHSEEIKVVVLEARRAKPVVNECLSISFGVWHGTDILVATDKDGVATIMVEGNQVTAKQVPGRACKGIASTKSISNLRSLMTISVLPDWYVSCQYSKQLVKDPAWLSESPAQRIPSFDVQDILNHGLVATNSCSNLKPVPKPGELVLMVRKRTFWEGMAS